MTIHFTTVTVDGINQENKPFARSGHMARNKLHWDANFAVGLSKQRKVGLDWHEFLCVESPTAYLASQCNLFRTMGLDRAKGLLKSHFRVWLSYDSTGDKSFKILNAFYDFVVWLRVFTHIIAVYHTVRACLHLLHTTYDYDTCRNQKWITGVSTNASLDVIQAGHVSRQQKNDVPCQCSDMPEGGFRFWTELKPCFILLICALSG